MQYVSKRWVALLPAVVLAAAGVACGGGDDGASAATIAPSQTEAQSGGEVGEPEREIEVSMKDNFFEPTEIRLKVGEAVTLTAKNDGVAIHNMHVLAAESEGKDFASAPMVNPGDSSSFDVQFSKAGTFKFQCDFHLPGMVGEIIVE